MFTLLPAREHISSLRPTLYRLTLSLSFTALVNNAAAQVAPSTTPTTASSTAPSTAPSAASNTAPSNAIQPPSLKQALEAGWQLIALPRAEVSRRGELAAKDKAASSWISGEPVAGIAYRTDRLNRNEGFREYEAEIELPLWNSGVRAATQGDIAAQRRNLDMQLVLSKLKLAGELRTLAAAAALAQVELELNQRKLVEAEGLAQDLSRRVNAGENARIDGLYAQVLVVQAQAAIAQAQGQLARLQSQWLGMTGLVIVSSLDETLLKPTLGALPALDAHPLQRQALAQLDSARTKLALARADTRDPMALGIGIASERGAFGGANETKLRIALRIPLGGENRNAPRLSAAQAEFDIAQAELDAAQRQLPAEIAVATHELRIAQLTQTAAQQRLRLSTEVQALITKSWRLGDSDLPTRLRADNEQFEASLSLAKANVDVQRAIANINQANGYLP